jgi:hypothetical protein
MRKNTPPDWVLIEAAKRCDWHGGKTRAQLRGYLAVSGAFSALCDMILKHEQPPVDRKLLCAQAAITGALIELDASRFPKKECMWDCCVRAIELWEDGFGT